MKYTDEETASILADLADITGMTPREVLDEFRAELLERQRVLKLEERIQ